MSEELDLIDRNELYNQIRLHLNRHSLGETAPWTTLTIGEIASIISVMPAVNAVKVIRCEDCDNYTPTESGKLGYCCVNDNIWFANDFCKHGRPRGEEYAKKI
jgi:hypothetical protein